MTLRSILLQSLRILPLAAAAILMSILSGCRHDELVVPTEYEIIGDEKPDSKIRGMYLVNEGNMGSNKCSLDYYDFLTGLYSRNFYAERNPNVVKELGDVGNDIAIYGDKLYVVVNCSHKVEVMHARTGVRIGQIDIPNCRFIRFYRGDAYVSSYVGPVLIDPSAPKGAVYRVDTLSLSVTGKVTVGYQPEEMEIVGDYMYVANSGGYRPPEYDNTVSVIQLVDFKQIQQIPVGINLLRIRKDRYGKLWVTSRGDYRYRPSRLYCMEKVKGYNRMEVTDTLPFGVSNMAFRGDSLLFYSTEWNEYTASNTITYGVVDVKTKRKISDNFITDGTERNITIPYGIAVHPETGEIYVTDAKNYVSSGTLHCYTPDGRLKWSVRTGDIPAHICFLPR